MSAVTASQVSSSNSTKTFLTALVANGGLLAVEIAAFLILKSRLGRIYSPRTYLPPPAKRAQKLPDGLWRWLPALLVEDPKDMISKNGLDAYMVLRFMKLLIWIFLVFTISTFLIIIPVDIVNVQGGSDPINRVSWSNIANKADQKRFAAHILMVYFLTCGMIRREMLHFLDMRHEFLISKSHSRLAQARTVLITSVPEELANEHDLRLFASFVPGGIDRVWIYRDTKALNKLFKRRQAACSKVEAAESRVLKHATDTWRIKELAHRKMQKKAKQDEEQGDMASSLGIPAEPSRELLDELVPMNARPKHRTGLLGLFGRKVETIPYCTEEIARLNTEIENDKWMETSPKDIVWENLDDGALEMTSRYVTSWLATIGLIIGWAFPVVFIGTLSNIGALCQDVHWLQWVCTAPNPIPGIIQGIIPPTLLAILFALLPLILRGFAWYECIPRYSLISMSVYRRFYLFLLIHGFLIVTLSSGFISLTQGLAGAGAALAQLFPIVIHFVRKWLLGRTPRQAFSVTFLMPSADFSLILPRLSLLATIGFAYSVLNPIINLFALLSYVMFYLAFKFLLTQVYDQPEEFETGGMYFPMAISNLFVGLYIEQICLACLFFLEASVSPTSSVAEGALMLALVVITASAQLLINRSFGPVTDFLPMSLATKMVEKHQQKRGVPVMAENEEEHDLFRRNGEFALQLYGLPQKLDQTLNTLKAKVKEEGEYLASPKLAREKLLKEQQSRAEAEKGRASTSKDIPLEDKELRQKAEEAVMSDLKDASSSCLSRRSNASSKNKRLVGVKVDSPTGIDLSDEDVSTEEEDQDEHAFDHPSTYVKQPWIWVPRDRLGLSRLLVGDLHAAGVDASDLGAIMDEKGVVEVSRNPPDEEWDGGCDS
ncbi:DUF221 family protein [Mycena pura]|uniref:DUF221 family protein n=1 Tax=Mycena pura TaxID=153505 RepID=A0AAD6VV74_9AGAR|nr:DUF221 family protein [Mycena pura]